MFNVEQFTKDCEYTQLVWDPELIARKQAESAAEAKKEKKDKKGSDSKIAASPAKHNTEKSNGSGKEDSQMEFPPFLLYHPFAVNSNISKRIQIHLLAAKILSIKKEFNEVYVKYSADKEAQIDNINEKTKRIGVINEELGVEAELNMLSLSQEEVHDWALSVSDAEIKSEKVMTKEERVVWERYFHHISLTF